MTRSKKLISSAIATLLFLSGCELVDAVEVTMSGPHCGRFGIPPELENKDLNVLDHRFDWDRIDGMIAVLEPYEHSHDPDVLFALGALYVKKAVTLSYDPAYFRRGVRLFRWAALCGHGPAAMMLSGLHSEGVPGAERDSEELLGFEMNPELGACLQRLEDPNSYIISSGRVWGCGLRMEDVQE